MKKNIPFCYSSKQFYPRCKHIRWWWLCQMSPQLTRMWWFSQWGSRSLLFDHWPKGLALQQCYCKLRHLLNIKSNHQTFCSGTNELSWLGCNIHVPTFRFTAIKKNNVKKAPDSVKSTSVQWILLIYRIRTFWLIAVNRKKPTITYAQLISFNCLMVNQKLSNLALLKKERFCKHFCKLNKGAVHIKVLIFPMKKFLLVCKCIFRATHWC